MLPVTVCLLAVALLLVAEHRGARRARAVAKLSASSAFVWAALAWGAALTPFGQLLLVGLALCWVGDALLLPAGRSAWFQLGIGAFLLAHLAYALACTRLALGPGALAAVGGVVGLGAWLEFRWLSPHVPSAFRWPVLAYLGAISLMVAVAVTAVVGGAPALLGVGAVGFALSDLAVARNRFVSPGFANKAWGLPAYYLSQLAIAYSVALVA